MHDSPASLVSCPRSSRLSQTRRAAGSKGDRTERIGELEDVDFITRQSLAHHAKLLTMTDEEFNEYIRLSKDLRKVLRSILAQPAKA